MDARAAITRHDAAMRILPLAETPHAAEIADWLHAEWWAEDGWSREATEAWLRAATGPAMPICYIAEVEGAPVGTATLDIDDLATRMDLTPWLANLLVPPAWRGRGIGAELVRHVEQAAAALGHARLWLFTPSAEGFYAARGWARVGTEPWRGRAVALMTRELAPASPRDPAPPGSPAPPP